MAMKPAQQQQTHFLFDSLNEVRLYYGVLWNILECIRVKGRLG